MFQLDSTSRIPIHDKIVNGILRLRTVGGMKSGDKLPSVRSLALKLGINPNTVQKAYAILEADGIIYSVSGKGSFISEDSAAADAILQSAADEFKMAVENARRMGLDRARLEAVISEIYEGGITDDKNS